MLRWLGRISTSLLAFLLGSASGGCAHITVDPNGTRHVSGFMRLTLPPTHPNVAADVVRLRALGLTVTRDPATGAQFTLGYSDTTIVVMKNNAVMSQMALKRAINQESPEEE